MDHALIIRTRNRHKLLKNCLDFYFFTNYKGTIYIADDSQGQSLDQNVKIVRDYNSKLKLYHYISPTSNLHNRGARVNLSTINTIELVEEKYFTIACDDDVSLVHDFFDYATNFLSSNTDYSAVHSNEVKINFTGSKPDVDFNKYWSDHPNSDDPMDRIFEYFCLSSLLYFGVVSKDSCDSLVKEYRKIYGTHPFSVDIDNSLWWLSEEISWMTLISIAGKSKFIPHHRMSIRSNHDRIDGITNQLSLEGTIENRGAIIGLLHSSDEYDLFKNSVRSFSRLVQIKGTKYTSSFLEESLFTLLTYLAISRSGSFFSKDITEKFYTSIYKTSMPPLTSLFSLRNLFLFSSCYNNPLFRISAKNPFARKLLNYPINQSLLQKRIELYLKLFSETIKA